MRLGRVIINMNYVVDLDNPQMVEEAKSSVYEDIMNAVKYNELSFYIDIVEDNTAKEGEIPEWLSSNEHEEMIEKD